VLVAGGEIHVGAQVRAELGPCKGKLVLRNLVQRALVSAGEEGPVEQSLLN
jgi:hypothetical protein